MLKSALPVVLMLLVPCLAGANHLNNVAHQTVSFQVSPIEELSVSGNPGLIHVVTASAGQDPTDVDDSSTTYTLTTNEADCAITAKLDSAMPTGMELMVDLAAPTGAMSLGFVALSTSDQNVVTGISSLIASGKGITYRCCADASAGTIAQTSRTVTLTLLGER
jgi:hypothetical protein